MKKIILIISVMFSIISYSQTNNIPYIYYDREYDIFSNVNFLSYQDISIATSTNMYIISNETFYIKNVPSIINNGMYLFLFTKEQWNDITNFYKTTGTIESITFYK